MDFSSNKALAKSLKDITIGCKDDLQIAKLLKTMATIAMNEAGYISSGHYPVSQYYHYGLALDFYTHFTVRCLHYVANITAYTPRNIVTYSSICGYHCSQTAADVCTRSYDH